MSFNVTIDDASSQIRYEPVGAWRDIQTDANLQNYIGNSYHMTTQAGASVSLTFTGTGVHVIGSRRNTHGEFTVKLNNQPDVVLNAFSNTDVFQQVIAVARGMPLREHTITITNQFKGGQTPTLDIDAFMIETPQEGESLQAINTPPNQGTRKSQLPVILGSLFGVFAFLGLLAALFILLRRRKLQANRMTSALANPRFGFNIGFGLKRTNTNSSNATAVDPEAGGITHTGPGKKLKWKLNGGVVGGLMEKMTTIPLTPPLPIQAPSPSSPDILFNGKNRAAVRRVPEYGPDVAIMPPQRPSPTEELPYMEVGIALPMAPPPTMLSSQPAFGRAPSRSRYAGAPRPIQPSPVASNRPLPRLPIPSSPQKVTTALSPPPVSIKTSLFRARRKPPPKALTPLTPSDDENERIASFGAVQAAFTLSPKEPRTATPTTAKLSEAFQTEHEPGLAY